MLMMNDKTYFQTTDKNGYPFYYEVVKSIKTFVADEDSGETIELNLISYKHGRPKYDLRRWRRIPKSEERMLKGFTMTKEELIAIKDGLGSIDFDQIE